MCGRFCLYADSTTVIEHFSLKHNVVLKPRYNIAPSQLIPVIRTPGQLEFLPWGLRPVWLKEGQNSFINARMETLSERPAFKQAYKQRRCLIVASGYYEWKQVGNHKQPYFISAKTEKLLAFAGVCDTDTCAIITKPSYQPEIKAIHARMPVIINSQNYESWLNPKTNPELLQLYMQNIDYIFDAVPVSTKVNNPQHDFSECINTLQ